MTAALQRVKRAHTAKLRADDRFRAAIREAYAAGTSYGELGRLLGVSRQAVRQYVNPKGD